MTGQGWNGGWNLGLQILGCLLQANEEGQKQALTRALASSQTQTCFLLPQG